MSEVTLSRAVRSNLLNLQATANKLASSQERLSTGLKVNSALDNPTNFFIAEGLKSKANDLSALSDAVSNAVQTVAAADKGITAITKLVESAQATARQALQTSTTIATDAQAAVSAGTSNVTGSGLASTAGFANGDTLTLSGGGFSNVSISFTNTGGSTSGATLDITAATVTNVASAINAQAGATIASVTNGKLTITGQNTTAGITAGGTNSSGIASSTVTLRRRLRTQSAPTLSPPTTICSARSTRSPRTPASTA
jgi:flagellin-like hook-associated protein FlgL